MQEEQPYVRTQLPQQEAQRETQQATPISPSLFGSAGSRGQWQSECQKPRVDTRAGGFSGE